MSRNNAQQAAAQVAKTRETLSKQGQRKGLAESVRKDIIKDDRRGKGHDAPRNQGSADAIMHALFCAPQMS